MEIIEFAKKISDSKKYGDMNYDSVLSVAQLYPYSEEKVRSKLHQIWGAYYSTRPNFEKLKKKYLSKEISLFSLLSIHSSTKERVDEYREIFEHIFLEIGQHTGILDLGCGMNPVFQIILGKKLKRYLAVDIDIAQQDFLNFLFTNEKLPNFEAKVGDALIDIFEPVDTVFAFKLLPVLDQISKEKTDIFLQNLKCKYLVVTFPNKSLGGKEKGMKSNYKDIYISRIEKFGFTLVSEKEFKNESVYIFSKSRFLVIDIKQNRASARYLF